MGHDYTFLCRRLSERGEAFIQDTYGEYYSLSDYLGEVGWSSMTLLSGSFRPVHEGHLEILRWLKNADRQNVFAEIGIKHIEKPQVSQDDLYQRLLPFIGHFPVLVTDKALMIEKVGLLRNLEIQDIVIGMGYDVACRMIEMSSPMAIAGIGADFWVFPRKHFQPPAAALPVNMKIIDAPRAYDHVSSTELRRTRQD